MSADLKISKKVNALLLVLFTGLLLHLPSAAASDNKEIDFLLTYIAKSDCLFIRNGKEHQADEARKHLEMKYSRSKGRIKTADQFIDRIASESSFTGRPYQVVCGQERSLTKDWLKKALSSYRASTGKQNFSSY